MSLKMAANAWFTELCEYEKEINSTFYWKMQKKKVKSLMLRQIEFLKILLSIGMKIVDCLVNIADNS